MPCLDPAPDASNAQKAAPWPSDTWSGGGRVFEEERWRKRKQIRVKSVGILYYIYIHIIYNYILYKIIYIYTFVLPIVL